MLSRKSGSSEVQPDSRRSSLRRLSSIASFQALFSRRRSNNPTNSTAASSSSNLSLTSSNANGQDASSVLNSSTNSLQNDDTLTELPHPPATHHPARRSSYICLPDDPVGGMPRSRTFSNLPLPSRAKKTPPLMPSQSHSRLPSAYLPPTRPPSPQLTTRKHSHSRLLSMESKPPPVRNRVKRSDTEPLLRMDAQQSHLPPRSTAFKENISLSPIKPLPALDMSSCGAECPASSSPHMYDTRSWTNSSGVLLPREPNSSPLLAQRFQQAKLTANRDHKSSPIQYKPRRINQGSGVPVQRLNSQPILASQNHALRSSHQGEIRQSRLMSTRQAPTPPTAKTPFPTPQAHNGAKKMTIARKPAPPRDVTSQSLFSPRSTGMRHPTATASPHKPNQHEVRTSEPQAYWSGRLCSLLDRYRNEELDQQLSQGSHFAAKAQTDKMHATEASEAGIHRAFEYLHKMCITQTAKDSLTLFQYQYADLMKMPELRKMAPIVLGGGRKEEIESVGSPADDHGGAELGMSEIRKMSFMDRLLGKQKRRSLVLA